VNGPLAERIAAGESLVGDSLFVGTPHVMGVSSLRRERRDRRGWLPGLFDLSSGSTVDGLTVR
jgi:hypothetical protein